MREVTQMMSVDEGDKPDDEGGNPDDVSLARGD